MSTEHEDGQKPRVGIFYCGGAMSSVGELTHEAAFEVLKQLGPQEVGMGCVSALAAGVPNHFETMQNQEKVLVIDGCPNSCVRRIVKEKGAKMDAYINFGNDLGIEKKGPFKPLSYSQEDFERAVDGVTAKIRDMEGSSE
ncbi:MAG: putative zinc-binding protein [Spirochaeta sp.]|nr:putative zinc-binding protein [Spirochaeta sp.]